jgi:hypothetical protein
LNFEICYAAISIRLRRAIRSLHRTIPTMMISRGGAAKFSDFTNVLVPSDTSSSGFSETSFVRIEVKPTSSESQSIKLFANTKLSFVPAYAS